MELKEPELFSKILKIIGLIWLGDYFLVRLHCLFNRGNDDISPYQTIDEIYSYIEKAPRYP